MLHRNLSSFLSEDVHHGTFIFTCDACSLCEQFEKDLASYDTSTWVAVEVTNDEKFILESLFGVKGFPFTIVFIDNKPALVKRGVLFRKQLDEIFSFMKANNLPIVKSLHKPISAFSPVILSFPHGNHEYKVKVFNDSISKGESPIEFMSMYSDILDMHNVHSTELLHKLQEPWNSLIKKIIIYLDEGVDSNMLNEILDATSRGREVEFRRCND